MIFKRTGTSGRGVSHPCFVTMHARGRYESGIEKGHVKAVLNKKTRDVRFSAEGPRDSGQEAQTGSRDNRYALCEHDDKSVSQFSEAKGKNWEIDEADICGDLE